MKQEQANEIVRVMMVCAQKARSNILEFVGHDEAGKQAAELTNPWLFGERNILIALDRVISRIDAGGNVEGGEFYNLVWLISNKIRPILAAEVVYGSSKDGYRIPEVPDIQWMRGFE